MNRCEDLLQEFILHLQSNNLVKVTIDRHRAKLIFFFSWLQKRGKKELHQLTENDITLYQSYLYRYKNNNKLLTLDNRLRHLASLKKFFTFLLEKNQILFDPSCYIDLPKIPQYLPRDILSDSETARLFACPDLTSSLGLRDRAILEVFYATGIRNGELLALKIGDVNREDLTLKITGSKGLKDRIIPISDRALRWIDKYIQQVREKLATKKEMILFLTWRGKNISKPNLIFTIRKYFRKAQLNKKGGIRVFRHTLATKMLEGGADTRFIQEMLGHSSLQSTQIYTRVSIQKLQEIHAQTHPRP